MGKLLFSGFLAMFFILSITWVFAYEKVSIIDNDNEMALENATRNAVNQSVNLGVLRTQEKVTIDPQMARDLLLRQYAESVGFYEGERTLNVFKNPLGGTPFLATDAYATIEPTGGLTEGIHQETRSRTVQIIESRNLTK